MRYWIGWWQTTPDPRPLRDPPNAAILGWWQTGLRDVGQQRSLVALVSAPSADDARAAVRIDWPEASDWRFCSEYPDTWRPTSDRFPVTGWSSERIGGGQ